MRYHVLQERSKLHYHTISEGVMCALCSLTTRCKLCILKPRLHGCVLVEGESKLKFRLWLRNCTLLCYPTFLGRLARFIFRDSNYREYKDQHALRKVSDLFRTAQLPE